MTPGLPQLHDGIVNRFNRLGAILLVVALLPWVGMLRALPHNHADVLVPQEALGCSASSPTSHEFHLHGVGHHLPPHLCLACLAGSSHAEDPVPVTVAVTPSAAPLAVNRVAGVQSSICSHLPLVRGPPAAT